MGSKPRVKVPQTLWRLSGKRAMSLTDAIVRLVTLGSIQPEQCRCRGLGCLGCSRDKLAFLLRPGDPIHYRKLLDRCFVILPEQLPPLPSFWPTSWWSQREILEKTIETMGCDSGNVICAKYDKSSPVLELLTTSWEFLLSRIGHGLMIYLLHHTSIFLPFQGQTHQQVSGPPLRIPQNQNETSSVCANKRKMDESLEPSKKRLQVSSTFNDCRKDEPATVTSDVGKDTKKEPKRRFRLYLKRRRKLRKLNCPKVDDEAPSVTSGTHGETSTGIEAGIRNLQISMSGSLTDFTKQEKLNCPKVDDEAPSVTSGTHGETSTGIEAGIRNLQISMSGSLTDFTKQAKPVKRD